MYRRVIVVILLVGCHSEPPPPDATSSETDDVVSSKYLTDDNAGPIEILIATYLDQTDWQGRAQYVLRPERAGPAMQSHYEVYGRHLRARLLDAKLPDAALDVGDTMRVACRAEPYYGGKPWKTEYFVTRTSDTEYKIDWLRSYRLEIQKFVDFHTRPQTNQSTSGREPAATRDEITAIEPQPPRRTKITISGIELDLAPSHTEAANSGASVP